MSMSSDSVDAESERTDSRSDRVNDGHLSTRADAEASHWRKRAKEEKRLRKQYEQKICARLDAGSDKILKRAFIGLMFASIISIGMQIHLKFKLDIATSEEWKKKAAEETGTGPQKRFTEKADGAAAIWGRKAESEDRLSQRLERLVLQWEQNATDEKGLQEQCENKAEAKAAFKEWQEKVEKLEEEVEQWKMQADEQERLRKENEKKADAAAKQWHDQIHHLEKEVEEWKKQAGKQEELRKKDEKKVASKAALKKCQEKVEKSEEEVKRLKRQADEQERLRKENAKKADAAAKIGHDQISPLEKDVEQWNNQAGEQEELTKKDEKKTAYTSIGTLMWLPVKAFTFIGTSVYSVVEAIILLVMYIVVEVLTFIWTLLYLVGKALTFIVTSVYAVVEAFVLFVKYIVVQACTFVWTLLYWVREAFSFIISVAGFLVLIAAIYG